MPVTRSQARGRRPEPRTENPRPKNRGGGWRKLVKELEPRRWASNLFFNPQWTSTMGLLCILAEAVLCVVVIKRIKYTEIDWVTYMSQASGFLNGTLDYTKLGGPTGPLVYPAGHLYVMGALKYLTDGGVNIVRGQYIFAALYLLTLAAVFTIYSIHNKIPPYAYLFMCFGGYRIHSIFVLRLFNDPIASLLCYAAIICFLRNRWTIGCILFSLGVSVKMNILLFAPGLLVVLLAREGRLKTFFHLAVCAMVQVVVALPFLLTNPVGYVTRAFNLGRVFEFQWTVNFRFLGESLFVDRRLHLALLCGHLGCLALFASFTWLRPQGGLRALASNRTFKLSAHDILFPLFTSNLIGIAFARSLHYQFYSWYYHSLLFLLFATPFPPVMNLATLGLVEMVWNTFPSTPLSSAALHGLHAVLLIGLSASARPKPKAS